MHKICKKMSITLIMNAIRQKISHLRENEFIEYICVI